MGKVLQFLGSAVVCAAVIYAASLTGTERHTGAVVGILAEPYLLLADVLEVPSGLSVIGLILYETALILALMKLVGAGLKRLAAKFATAR